MLKRGQETKARRGRVAIFGSFLGDKGNDKVGDKVSSQGNGVGRRSVTTTGASATRAPTYHASRVPSLGFCVRLRVFCERRLRLAASFIRRLLESVRRA